MGFGTSWCGLAGIITNSWFDLIEAGPHTRIENNWPDSNLPPYIGQLVTNAQQSLSLSQDIGDPDNPHEPGSALLLSNGILELVGGGLSASVSDAVHFAFRKLSGDFDAAVRLRSLGLHDPRRPVPVQLRRPTRKNLPGSDQTHSGRHPLARRRRAHGPTTHPHLQPDSPSIPPTVLPGPSLRRHRPWHQVYFPELYLAQWFEETRNETVTVWCFQKTGVRPLLENYRVLVDHLSIDRVLLTTTNARALEQP